VRRFSTDAEHNTVMRRYMQNSVFVLFIANESICSPCKGSNVCSQGVLIDRGLDRRCVQALLCSLQGSQTNPTSFLMTLRGEHIPQREMLKLNGLPQPHFDSPTESVLKPFFTCFVFIKQ